MILPRLEEFPYFSLDVETTGLKWWKDKVFGIAISTPDGNDYYWDIRVDPKIVDFLRDVVPRAKLIVNHNIKFDVHFCREIGIHFPMDRIDDTMIRAALIDEHLMSYDLDSLGQKYIGVGKNIDIYKELADLFGGRPTKDAQMPNLHRAPASLVGKYAKQDTRTALKLWEWQNGEIENQSLGNVCELERKLLPVLIDMEYKGVRVDVDRSEHAVHEISKQVKVMQHRLDSLAGFPINPNPSKSIKDLFKPTINKQGQWVLIDGTVAKSTPSGAASINTEVLRSMKHPAAKLILTLRKLIKTRDTFLKGHILSHHHNGVVHANYNQTKSDNELGTITGRLSVNSPALQQIHKRDAEIASIVRSLFLPDEGHDWVCNDYHQMDFRVFAHYLNNPDITRTYTETPETDFHQTTSDLTGLPRSPRFAGDPNAKQINLGLIFGMGQGKLAEEMGLPCYHEVDGRGRVWTRPGPEAVEIFNKYHAAVPGVRELLGSANSVARLRGYVKTIMGRRIRFPIKAFSYKAGGLIFQGTAADALKVKLVELHDYLKTTDARLLLNVHDEFDTSIPIGDSKIKQEINHIITKFDGINTPIKFRIPILTDQGVGSDWWIASK